jgi:hypothetical protein
VVFNVVARRRESGSTAATKAAETIVAARKRLEFNIVLKLRKKMVDCSFTACRYSGRTSRWELGIYMRRKFQVQHTVTRLNPRHKQ